METKYRSFLEDKVNEIIKIKPIDNTFADGLDYKDVNYYKNFNCRLQTFLPEMRCLKLIEPQWQIHLR